MIRALIVDDEKKARDLLSILLKENCPQVEIAGMAASVKEAHETIMKLKPDLVFLDIEMAGETGFDLLARFESITFSIIFITAFDKYALKALKFSALDYLLKPVDEKELVQAVKKAEKEQDSGDLKQKLDIFLKGYYSLIDNKIAISSMEGFEFIEINDIIRCEAEGKYTDCYLVNDRKIVATKNIKEFEDILSTHRFFRVHHSHLINLRFIKNYHKGRGGYVVMIDGATIPVAERKKDEFLSSLQKI